MNKYILPGLGVVAIVIVAVLLIWQKSPTPATPTEEAPGSKITILVPQDINGYKKAIDACAGEQMCRNAAVATSLFIKQELTVAFTADIIQASALTAANVIPTQAGVLKIAYWKIQNNTAYILLNIHLDGWAGVSLSLARIEPIIEKSLLQFPEIKQVVFGYAPGDQR